MNTKMNTNTTLKSGLAAALALGAGFGTLHSVQAKSKMSGMSGMDMADMKAKNAQMLLQVASEEKTEVASLTAQKAALMKMGTTTDKKMAKMFGMWISMHKAAGPTLMKLIKQNGGDPSQAKILMAPELGSREAIAHQQFEMHTQAVKTSENVYGMTNSAAIKAFMHKRADGVARVHLSQLMPYHNMKTCPQCQQMMQGGGSVGMGGGMSNGMSGTMSSGNMASGNSVTITNSAPAMP